jgi:hypothetical protein
VILLFAGGKIEGLYIQDDGLYLFPMESAMKNDLVIKLPQVVNESIIR